MCPKIDFFEVLENQKTMDGHLLGVGNGTSEPLSGLSRFWRRNSCGHYSYRNIARIKKHPRTFLSGSTSFVSISKILLIWIHFRRVFRENVLASIWKIWVSNTNHRNWSRNSCAISEIFEMDKLQHNLSTFSRGCFLIWAIFRYE